jgi:hypothetical protein
MGLAIVGALAYLRLQRVGRSDHEDDGVGVHTTKTGETELSDSTIEGFSEGVFTEGRFRGRRNLLRHKQR